MSLLPKKMLKADYVSVINYHFSKEGKKIKNIRTATLQNLKNLLTEYDIDLENTYCEMMELRLVPTEKLCPSENAIGYCKMKIVDYDGCGSGQTMIRSVCEVCKRKSQKFVYL